MVTREPRRVLLVDDDEDLVESMRAVLELEGVWVATARTSEQADAVLRSGFEPSVVFVDLRLAREGGDTYARRLKASSLYGNLPVVLMSGDRGALGRAIGAADATIAKPFLLDELCATITALAPLSGAPVSGARAVGPG